MPTDPAFGVTAADFLATFPLLLVAFMSIAVVAYDIFADDSDWIPVITGATLALALGYALWQLPDPAGTAFFGMVRTGGVAALVNVIVLLSALLTIPLLAPYLRQIRHGYGEVYALLLVAVAGMMALGTSANLVTVFVGLETMSVALYILTALVRDDEGAIESALKYFLLGAFSSAFLLYGIALLYGATGTMDLDALGVRAATASPMLFWGGVGMLFVGFLFKVSAAPFHMWTPDVYQGAPTPIAGFMATASKASAFAALVLVLAAAMPEARWQTALAVVALLSMVVGNVIALAQKNVKRMLAYSSIAHAGYVLTGIAAGTPEGYSGALYYLLVYAVMNVGAFGVMAYLEHDGVEGRAQTVDSLAGTGPKHPLLGVVMAVCLFSLLGFPPLAGFFGKVAVFGPAVRAGLTWLAIAGVLTSALSAAYYLRVLYAMWMKAPAEGEAVVQPSTPLTRPAAVALVACAVLLVALTFLPSITTAAHDYFVGARAFTSSVFVR